MREQSKGQNKAVKPAPGQVHGGIDFKHLMAEMEMLIIFSQEYNLKALDDLGMTGSNTEIYKELKELKKNYRSMVKALKIDNIRHKDLIFNIDLLANIFNGEKNEIIASFINL